MPEAPGRISLSESERKVLADLQLFSDDEGRVVISSRQLKETTGLSLPTVLNTLQRLADRRLIQTYTPPRPKVCEHTVLFRDPVRLTDAQDRNLRSRRSSTGGRP